MSHNLSLSESCPSIFAEVIFYFKLWVSLKLWIGQDNTQPPSFKPKSITSMEGLFYSEHVSLT